MERGEVAPGVLVCRLVPQPGDLVFKAPQPVAHVLEPGDTPARMLEIIAPAGFEKYFEELSDMGGATQA